MKEETNEWLRLAESDLRVARRESRVTDEPSYSAVCFHAQQAAEKFNITITKTHDLVYLLEQIVPIKPLWSVYRRQLEQLTDYAVDIRYPGEEATREEALQSVKLATEMRDVIVSDLQ